MTLESAIAENQQLRAQNEQLRFELDQLKRLIFGHRAERLAAAEGHTLSLFESEAAPEIPGQATAVPSHTRQQPKRSSLPEGLPRTVEVIDLPDEAKACPCCGEMRHCIGEAVTEKLDYVPASLSVLQYRRPKYACKGCEGEIAVAALPAQPIEQGMAAPGLLAHVIVSKFCDHLPLNRQAGMLRRHGIELSPNTLGDWVLACGELLQPVHARLCEWVRQSDILHTDDTILPLAEKGGAKQARAWVYHDPNSKLTAYEFTENRAGIHAQTWLQDWHGYLVADAYGAYDKLYANERIREVACWAHARRKYFEIAKQMPKRGLAHEALDWIARLYHQDNGWQALLPDERQRRRQAESGPMLTEFKQWLDAHYPQLPPKGPTAKAMAYTLGNWHALIRHLEDGRIPLDNNAAERALRPIAVGRGNWLFTGSVRGGQAAAVLLSLVHSARLCGHNPYAYLKDLLTRYPSAKADDLDDLLPHRWQAI